MKRVVTGVNEQGRSYIVSVEEFDATQPQKIWDYEPSHIQDWIAAIDPADAADWIAPDVSGGTRWFFAPMMPGGAQAEFTQMQGVDENGFHTTRTIDFDFIFDGEITLLLDEGSIALETGDFVIQQATRHGWRNETDKPCIMLTLIHRPDSV